MEFEGGQVTTALIPDPATAEEPFVLIDDLMPGADTAK